MSTEDKIDICKKYTQQWSDFFKMFSEGLENRKIHPNEEIIFDQIVTLLAFKHYTFSEMMGEFLPDPEGILEKTGLLGPPLLLSAKNGTGLKNLESRMLEMVRKGTASGDYSLMLTNRRHFEALRRAREEIRHALRTLEEKREPELLAFDVKSALDCIGELTGQVTNQEILDTIFSSFCIGK